MKRLMAVLVVLSLMSATISIAGENPLPKTERLGAIKLQVTVTDIKDNVITVKDNKGVLRKLELSSVQGIVINSKGICEEDCGRLKIGEKDIKVQRVIGPEDWKVFQKN